MKKLLILLLLTPAIVFGQDSRGIVVPHAQESVVGNGASTAPFTMPLGNSARYQQIYSASEFSGVGAPDLLILSLYFRTDENGGAVRATIPDIQFDLSWACGTTIPLESCPNTRAGVRSNRMSSFFI